MDNTSEEQAEKKKKIIFAATAVIAVLIVVGISYVTLSKIKNNQTDSPDLSQEQFQTAPELSTALQSECQASAQKIAKLNNILELEHEFKNHAEPCREVFFAIEDDSQFRKEGMYADLAVDLAHFALKESKDKALEILKFAKSLKPWEFYLGPVSCDSHHVMDAYLESINLPSEKLCIKLSDYTEKLVPELRNKKFNLLKSMLSNAEVVWLGQPESDVGCPEKISAIIDLATKLSSGNLTVDQTKQSEADSPDLVLSLKTDGDEKLALVFRPENECLQIRSLLVPNLDVVE